MTQVPSLADTPRPPAMFGTETLAMVVSSTTMKLASASTMPAAQSIPPVSAAGATTGGLGFAATGAIPPPEPWEEMVASLIGVRSPRPAGRHPWR